MALDILGFFLSAIGKKTGQIIKKLLPPLTNLLRDGWPF